MFSSNELISFVFSNETDVYYGEDLLKRNRNQYLWERLHSANYSAVYFLRAKGEEFTIDSYGDKDCCQYSPGGGFFLKSKAKAQGEWLLKQLQEREKKAAAFVCPLEDFCQVMSAAPWKSVLRQMAESKKRTGIFVLTAPATPEGSARLLLESPVFDREHLAEETVLNLRSGDVKDLYGSLKSRKSDNCLYLNAHTWQGLRGLLVHLLMEYPQRLESMGQIDIMADYLLAWLRDPEKANQTLFFDKRPFGGYPYSELFELLSDSQAWDRLVQQSSRYKASESYRANRAPNWDAVAVVREKNSYAGRCTRLQLPKWLSQREDADQRAKELLRGIRSEVARPKNRLENSTVRQAVHEFLDQLGKVDQGDDETLLQILKALKFCVSYVYTQEHDPATQEILKIIEVHKDAVQMSRECFLRQRDWDSYSKDFIFEDLHETNRRQAKEQLEIARDRRDLLNDAIMTRELALRNTIFEKSSAGVQEKLKRDLELLEKREQTLQKEREQAPDRESKRTQPKDSGPKLSEEDEPEIYLELSDLSIRPPSYD